MSDLKTLKDFELWKAPNINRELSVEVYRLKQEAIKHYKQFLSWGVNEKKDSKECYLFAGAMAFIKKFFNITEEDLK